MSWSSVPMTGGGGGGRDRHMVPAHVPRPARMDPRCWARGLSALRLLCARAVRATTSSGVTMTRFHRMAFRGLGIAIPVLSLMDIGASEARAATFTELALQNGWTNASFTPFVTRNAAVSLVSGIVQFQG